MQEKLAQPQLVRVSDAKANLSVDWNRPQLPRTESALLKHQALKHHQHERSGHWGINRACGVGLSDSPLLWASFW
jgi:hypothetical protein